MGHLNNVPRSDSRLKLSQEVRLANRSPQLAMPCTKRAENGAMEEDAVEEPEMVGSYPPGLNNRHGGAGTFLPQEPI